MRADAVLYMTEIAYLVAKPARLRDGCEHLVLFSELAKKEHVSRLRPRRGVYGLLRPLSLLWPAIDKQALASFNLGLVPALRQLLRPQVSKQYLVASSSSRLRIRRRGK